MCKKSGDLWCVMVKYMCIYIHMMVKGWRRKPSSFRHKAWKLLSLYVLVDFVERGGRGIEELSRGHELSILRVKSMFASSLLKGTIFCFSTRAGHMSLFLISPRNQRRIKKKAITSGGPAISGVSYPISIKKYRENKRRLSRVEKAMKESAF